MVAPAKAGTQLIRLIEEMNPSEKTFRIRLSNFLNWVPAFAGTTSSDFP